MRVCLCLLSLLSFLCVCLHADDVSLIRVGEAWRYFGGTREPSSPSAWRQIGFDDAAWAVGMSGFSGGFGGEATQIRGTQGVFRSIYFRKSFQISRPDTIVWLSLRMDYSDGFIAYLNGVEIARRNMPREAADFVPFDALALGAHPRAQIEEIDVSEFSGLLVGGENVLAIQVHNANAFSSGFALVPEFLGNFLRGPFVQNASTEAITVVWKTPVPSTSRVEYGLTPELGEVQEIPGAGTEHAASITGLQPGTRYYYRVASSAGGETALSPVEWFKTLASEGGIRFAVVGDTGTGAMAQLEIAKVLRESQPDIVLHAGDVIYPSFIDAYADTRCLSVYGEQMRNVPYYFALGNHDLNATSAAYLRAFHLPTNDVPAEVHLAENTSPEHYYSFDHGDAHFSVLFVPFLYQYDFRIGDPQYRWLKADLERSKKPWKFIMTHHPLMTSSLHRNDDYNQNGIPDRLDVLNAVLPLARENGVQIVFSGHDHVFERSNPIDGVYSIVTGGGGAGLYPLTTLDRASAQAWIRYNFVTVSVEENRLTLDALDTDGAVFDSMSFYRALPELPVFQASWHSPTIESAASHDGDGNVPGQTFDLIGTPIPTLSGKFSSLGQVYVNNDTSFLYVGIEECLLYGDNNVFLFLEAPQLPGVSALAGIGNGIVDPESEGVDGLDFLENLSFTNFSPAIGCVLGDEWADSQFRSFARESLELNIGQGLFYLDQMLSDVKGTRFQQFNRSPQAGGIPDEANANFIELAIPYEALGGLEPGQTIRIAAVVGGSGVETKSDRQSRELDSSYLGMRLSGEGIGPRALEGVSVQLALNPDPDGDGLSSVEEGLLGTNPALSDSDGDSLLDGWEILNRLNPLSSDGNDGEQGDPDGDKFPNRSEQFAGTDPQDPASNLRIWIDSLENGRARITWTTVPGKRYGVEMGDGWQGAFKPVDSPLFPAIATASTQSYEDPGESLGVGSRFYRVVVLP